MMGLAGFRSRSTTGAKLRFTPQGQHGGQGFGVLGDQAGDSPPRLAALTGAKPSRSRQTRRPPGRCRPTAARARAAAGHRPAGAVDPARPRSAPCRPRCGRRESPRPAPGRVPPRPANASALSVVPRKPSINSWPSRAASAPIHLSPRKITGRPTLSAILTPGQPHSARACPDYPNPAFFNHSRASTKKEKRATGTFFASSE